MAQPEYNLTFFGTGNTSTAFTQIGSTSGMFLHTISIGSSGGTGTVIFYKGTSSSTGNEAIVLTGAGALGTPQTYIFDIQMPLLGRGQTTSTAEMTVTWA